MTGHWIADCFRAQHYCEIYVSSTASTQHLPPALRQQVPYLIQRRVESYVSRVGAALVPLGLAIRDQSLGVVWGAGWEDGWE